MARTAQGDGQTAERGDRRGTAGGGQNLLNLKAPNPPAPLAKGEQRQKRIIFLNV